MTKINSPLFACMVSCAQNSPFGQIGTSSQASDTFTYKKNILVNYSLGWFFEQAKQDIQPSVYVSAYQGVVFKTEPQRIYLSGNYKLSLGTDNKQGDGNVRRGTTTPQYKLNVSGADLRGSGNLIVHLEIQQAEASIWLMMETYWI